MLRPCLANPKCSINITMIFNNAVNFFIIELLTSSLPLTIPTAQLLPTEVKEEELTFPEHFL